MNIDERLEALTQSVELLAGMQIETEKRMSRLIEINTHLQESMVRVVNILVNHDQRLDNLEGRRPQ